MELEQFKKLKPGDSVICLKDSYPYYAKDKTYVCRGPEGDGYLRTDSISTVLDDTGKKNNGWHYKFFNLIVDWDE